MAIDYSKMTVPELKKLRDETNAQIKAARKKKGKPGEKKLLEEKAEILTAIKNR